MNGIEEEFGVRLKVPLGLRGRWLVCVCFLTVFWSLFRRKEMSVNFAYGDLVYAIAGYVAFKNII